MSQACAVVRQPSMHIEGAGDPSHPFVKSAYEQLETHMPGLQKKILLEGVGHSVAEEQPEKVNELLLAFLGGLKHV